MKQIVYVGLKELKGDNVSGTGLTWVRGQVHDVEDDEKANKLLKHDLIWRDATGKTPAEVEALLLPEFEAIKPIPAVSVVAKDATVWDPFPIVVPGDVLAKLRKGELVAAFMSEADADAFSEWKLERDTRPDPAPKQTGPKPQARETRLGLETKPKAA